MLSAMSGTYGVSPDRTSLRRIGGAPGGTKSSECGAPGAAEGGATYRGDTFTMSVNCDAFVKLLHPCTRT
jgi:hypothetical protein